MAGWDDVRRLALELPETSEGTTFGYPSWNVRRKAFAWERPLRKKEADALGDTAPSGPIFAAYVEDVGVKDAMIATEPGAYFATPHFDGYAIVLVKLDRLTVAELREVIVEAWLARAPRRLARDYAEAHGLGD